MENLKSYLRGISVYPGEYVPLMKAEEVNEALKRPHNGDVILPLVNVTELAGSFKIEVAMPGINREDLLIHADGNNLTVCAVHKDIETDRTAGYPVQEFKHDYFNRIITLPEKADPEFACAEYKAGILCMHIPKVEQPAKDLHTHIVVY